MNIQLEVGKSYRTRKGNKVYIFEYDASNLRHPFSGKLYLEGKVFADTWAANGRNDTYRDKDIDDDIVALWEEPAVAKVYDLPDPDVSPLWVHRTRGLFFVRPLGRNNPRDVQVLSVNYPDRDNDWPSSKDKGYSHLFEDKNWMPVTFTKPTFPPEESPEVKAFKDAVKGLGETKLRKIISQWHKTDYVLLSEFLIDGDYQL